MAGDGKCPPQVVYESQNAKSTIESCHSYLSIFRTERFRRQIGVCIIDVPMPSTKGVVCLHKHAKDIDAKLTISTSLPAILKFYLN